MSITNVMPQEMEVPLRNMIIKHEANKLDPYVDTEGNITIGIGRNLSGRGIFQDESDLMYKNDKDYFYSYLSNTYSWYADLNIARKCALVDMCFMGTKKFETFHRMIKAFEDRDYLSASLEILDSYYEKEVHGRAHDLARIIATGDL